MRLLLKCIAHPLNCALQGGHLAGAVTHHVTVQRRHRDRVTNLETFREILEHKPQSDTLPKHPIARSHDVSWSKDSVGDKLQ